MHSFDWRKKRRHILGRCFVVCAQRYAAERNLGRPAKHGFWYWVAGLFDRWYWHYLSREVPK